MKEIEYNDNDRFFIDPIGVTFVDESNEEFDQKQNMSLDGFTTTKDLDLQLESILKSIEPAVMEAIKKVSKK